jgi:preprotein translocase, secA subunit
MNFLKRLFDQDYRELKKFSVIADKIEELEEEYSKLSDYELKAKTDEFKNRLENGETLDDILVEAYATAREAAFRVNNEKPFYVQLLGAIAIHKGNIAEMKTGEGKTLTSVLPAYLNALDGKGTHIVTVNEYLADRDAKWMGRIHEFLGLSVGINLRDLTPQEKKKAYECDILYTTNNELGFDYLRDNMVTHKEDRVQRKLNFAIVDEVDSVLIDEARTPLIISGGDLKNVSMYEAADRFAKKLKKDIDYIYEEQNKSVTLTEEGVKKGEKEFHLANLYEVSNANLIHHINQALRANFSMRKDVDYVVNNGEIVIVDQFTGRLMKGRAYSDGLHQAIEAKENVKINQETKTLATITFQNLFRMYNKLSGMTGTAKTEEEEFNDIYNMRVICIPTNKPVARIDAPDLLYPTQKGKFTSLINEVEKRHKLGQPILIGTIAVETNELISQLLTAKNIEHEVLNAKNNAREAEIIAKAGQKGAVTVATNMAGRGTDIKLTDETKDLGGLCVLGTERHESRRIDNQLRGRSGRQGDPGFSQFYVSMEDDLMVRFGTDGLKNMLIRLGFEETEAITSKRFTKGLSSAQKRVEGNNFDIRKNLLQYDDVMNNQREIMYAKRNEILDSESIHDSILVAVENHVTDVVKSKLIDSEKLTKEDLQEIVEYFNTLLREDIKFDEISSMDSDAIIYFVKEKILSEYEEKIKELPIEVVEEFEKVITLSVVDKYWTEHINAMEHFREAIYLRGYGQQDPLRAYTVEGFDLFNKMLQNIDQEITLFLVKSEISQNQERQEISKSKMTNDGKVKLKNKPKKIEKVGRNDMCPCGSGKKYKQCCGK